MLISRKALPLLLLLFWLAVITCLSLVPLKNLPVPTLWDKLEHALAYAALTVLAGWVLRRHLEFGWAWAAAAGGAVAYGATLELAQALSQRGRHGDLMDVLANAVGAGVVLLAAWLIRLVTGGRRSNVE